MLMCNSLSQHVLKCTFLIPSWFTPNANGIACNVLISFSSKTNALDLITIYNVGLAWNLNQLRKFSYAHRALADKAYADAGSLLTPDAFIKGEREDLTLPSLRGG